MDLFHVGDGHLFMVCMVGFLSGVKYILYRILQLHVYFRVILGGGDYDKVNIYILTL